MAKSKVKISVKEATAEIAKLQARLKEMEERLDKMSASAKNGFSSLGANAEKAKASYTRLNNAIATAKNTIQQKEQALLKLAEAEKKAGNEADKMSKKTSKVGGGFKGLLSSVKALLAGFGIIMGMRLFANILRDSFKLLLTFDSIRFAMETVTKSVWEMEQSQKFLLELNRKFGAELIVTAERWIKFRAAAIQSNMTLMDTEKIFRSVTKASAVLGLDTQSLQSVYLALEQMLSKGKITTEELRRQLGEKLPGAMGIMAASMGITMDKLDDMMKKGEVLSHEVLPDFADALEVAYGIEAVEKVETLRSKIGRLTGQWQILINNIAEGEGIISQTLGTFISGMENLLGILTRFAANDDQKFRMDVDVVEDDWVKALDRESKAKLEALEKNFKVEERLRYAKQQIAINISKTTNEEEIKNFKAQEDEINRQLVEYGKRRNELKRGIAAEGFLDLQLELEKETEAYEDREQKIKDLTKKIYKEKGGFMMGPDADEIDRLKELNKEKYINLVNLQAEYNVKKKLLEVSGEPELSFDDDQGATKRIRELENIRDLEKEIQIEALKKLIESHNKILNAEETGWDRRIKIIKKNQEYMNRISALEFDIDVENIEAKRDKKIKALWAPPKKNEILPPIAERKQQELDIINEANQEIEIAQKRHHTNLVKNGNKLTKELISIEKDKADFKIETVKDEYNQEIIAAKEAYEASSKTSKDKIKLDKTLKRLSRELANEVIDNQIKILEAKKQELDLDQEIIDMIDVKINALKAMKEIEPPGEDGDWLEFWTTILDYAKDYADAIGDLVDNIYAGRIEKINAEIEAEKDKYDALILLAKNDAKEKETLERNKDLRIKQLEEKRLKEEQKQARARKAFAIADIAINTAAAIMRVVADGGLFFGIPMVPIVAALGAVQMAAVLAEPIPKYKEGGTAKKDEIAMINDGATQEYIERNGEILTTNRKNAIVGLRKGDIVHKNYNDLLDSINSDNKANMYNNIITGATGGSFINESEFNKLYNGIEGSISKGFKKAKLHTSINIINKNDNYKQKMSRW